MPEEQNKENNKRKILRPIIVGFIAILVSFVSVLLLTPFSITLEPFFSSFGLSYPRLLTLCIWTVILASVLIGIGVGWFLLGKKYTKREKIKFVGILIVCYIICYFLIFFGFPLRIFQKLLKLII
jgi:hypothetical protein